MEKIEMALNIPCSVVVNGRRARSESESESESGGALWYDKSNGFDKKT